MDGADKNFFLLSEQPFITKTRTVFMWLFRIAAVMWLVSSAFYVLYLLFSSVVEVLNFIKYSSFEIFFSNLIDNLIKITIFSYFVFICYFFITYREEYKKHLRRFALVIFLFNFFPIFAIGLTILEKAYGITFDISWFYQKWGGYKTWFFSIPETSFWWVITFSAICSVVISYISLCVYSDRYCIPFSEKIKKCWIKINLSVFWLLFLLYPIFQVYCYLYPCSGDGCSFRNTPTERISHYIGIYGF